MRLLICFFIINLPFTALSQITAAQQKSLNAYVEYANQSADEVTGIVKTIFDYYPRLGSKNTAPAPYVCPFQLDDYYATNAEKQSQALGSAFSTSINHAFKKLREAEARLDQKCKALDT